MPPIQQALLLKKKFGDLVLDKISIPTPGPGEIRVKILSSSLNPVDWKIQKHGIFLDEFPAILGSDIAGEVDELGPGVKEFDIRDRVFTQGLRSIEFAGFQQYALSRASNVSKIPPNVSFDGASSFPVALTAAYVGLYNRSPHGLEFTPPTSSSARGKYAGTPIVILGGASTVGQYTIQLAKVSGFSPIFTTASLKHTERLSALGATAVLDRNLPSSALAAAIVQRTQAPILTVYDAISTEDTQQTGLTLLAPGGRLAVVQQPTTTCREGRTIVQVIGGLGQPHNIALLSQFYHDVAYQFLEEGWLKPNNVEVLPDGLAGIPDGLRRLELDQVSGVKLVARPQET
ncbi:hypothetical protein HYPSUDRAFT_161272 [Hypholoma sublateritium FD-334 SS-4]|uniref:Enoyl reductase (ER) domain-containing protein n=1 Tax=Hypholoma sublateritium (strain FD-334 SS-4) TaxID=945553 RepID=A0A0D2P2F7_HYPSF|nr:hypothetical protein HYPSUDRAFT_161272 [Hypholoma sublateritium FD-334 SS-4]